MSLSVRGRLVVARYGIYIAVLFLLLSAVALGAAWSLWTNPATEVVSEEVNVEDYAVAAHTEAIVSGSNVTLYEQGQRLVDMPVYYFEETPGLTVVVNTSVPEGKSSRSMDASSVWNRSVIVRGPGGQVRWSVRPFYRVDDHNSWL